MTSADALLAILLAVVLGLVLAAPAIRRSVSAWLNRAPLDLDARDRCRRPGCDVNHRGAR